MKKIIIIFCLFAAILSSCKKSDFKGTDTSIPNVPVTVTNLFGFYNGVPSVSTSLATGTITITLNIPSSTGRTIKEISRVGVSNTPTNYIVAESFIALTAPSYLAGTYTSTPIAGSGTSATFTTSLTEFYSKVPSTASSNPVYTSTTAGKATSFLGRYFLFMVTLDNGDIIYPVGVRVYVNL